MVIDSFTIVSRLFSGYIFGFLNKQNTVGGWSIKHVGSDSYFSFLFSSLYSTAVRSMALSKEIFLNKYIMKSV